MGPIVRDVTNTSSCANPEVRGRYQVLIHCPFCASSKSSMSCSMRAMLGAPTSLHQSPLALGGRKLFRFFVVDDEILPMASHRCPRNSGQGSQCLEAGSDAWLLWATLQGTALFLAMASRTLHEVTHHAWLPVSRLPRATIEPATSACICSGQRSACRTSCIS